MPCDLFLVDGNHLLFRAADRLSDLHAAHPNRDGDRIGTGGIYGFLSVLSFAHPKYGGRVVVCWEGGHNFRYRIYPEYKGKRRKDPSPLEQAWYEDMLEQGQILRKILKAIGVDQARSPGFEADDTIGAYADRADRSGKKVVIYSGDHDLYQLLSPNVSIVCVRKVGKGKSAKNIDCIETPKSIRVEYGLRPSQWIDFLTLKGDTGDNIPGVRGIGEVKAKSLLKDFGSIDALESAMADGSEYPSITPSIRQAWEGGQDQIALWRQLVTLRKDAPIKVIRGKQDRSVFLRWIRKLKMKQFMTDSAKLGRLLAMGDR